MGLLSDWKWNGFPVSYEETAFYNPDDPIKGIILGVYKHQADQIGT
jgi:hypothetical protein